ncbi:phospholipase D-like domain-containing protein DpdK [Solirubrobacter soli]|uniref:phospholipase D-like domain-containing protein DpdK n=1 Tax=Solirubrobacter soli TaxID=363832 RepID=UPI0012F9D0E4|nr:phospholipase D-like domain-containing protein DpdK [Solirubrobacter soli]
MTRRRIFKGGGRSEREVETVLQNLFVIEALAPSSALWLISPWVTDLEVIDNRSSSFRGIEPLWPHRRLRLTEVLSYLAQRGTEVVVATRADGHNDAFHRRLEASSLALGAADRVRIVVDRGDEQHEKGLLGDGFFLSGSMNFTVRGVRLNDEHVTLSLDEDDVAAARINIRARYGGLR